MKKSRNIYIKVLSLFVGVMMMFSIIEINTISVKGKNSSYSIVFNANGGKGKMTKQTITRIDRVETGRYTFGTNFTKGDYLSTIVQFFVHVRGGAPFEVGRDKLLSFSPGRKRVTETFLNSFKGKDAKILR